MSAIAIPVNNDENARRNLLPFFDMEWDYPEQQEEPEYNDENQINSG